MKNKFIDFKIKTFTNKNNNQISNTLPRRELKKIFPDKIPNKIKIRVFQ